LKMMVAYEAAADWKEEKAMHRAFNAFSWDDPHVLNTLPEYLEARPSETSRVDYAFNALRPRPFDPKDPKQVMMATWLKARLFYYDSVQPFNFNPYARGS